jgi:hypothetical protein
MPSRRSSRYGWLPTGEVHAAVAGADLGDYAKKGDEFTYEKHGFIATAYNLPTDNTAPSSTRRRTGTT